MSENTEETNIIDLLVGTYNTVIKRKTVIIICFLLSFSLGITYLIVKSPVYKTEMIVSSPVVSAERISFFVEPLGKLAQEQNFSELARLLEIDIAIASKIKDIESKELKDETKASKSENYDSEVLRQQNCLVSVKIKNDASLSDTIQHGIVNYLRSNNFIKRRTDIEMNNLLNLKKRIKNEITELDSLRRRISRSNGQYSMMDPSSINNSIANLYQQELGIDLKMKLDDSGVNIIRDFARYKSPIEPRRNIVLILCFVASVIFSYIAILIISVKEKIQNNNQ